MFKAEYRRSRVLFCYLRRNFIRHKMIAMNRKKAEKKKKIPTVYHKT